MKAYVCSGDVTIGAAPKTLLAVIGAAARRPKVAQIIISSSGTPADAVVKFAVRRFTADGTGSAATTFAADPGDGSPTCTAKYNYTVEPTYAAGNMAEIAVNHRATVIETAILGGEFACAVGTANGIGIVALNTNADAWNITMCFEE